MWNQTPRVPREPGPVLGYIDVVHIQRLFYALFDAHVQLNLRAFYASIYAYANVLIKQQDTATRAAPSPSGTTIPTLPPTARSNFESGIPNSFSPSWLNAAPDPPASSVKGFRFAPVNAICRRP